MTDYIEWILGEPIIEENEEGETLEWTEIGHFLSRAELVGAPADGVPEGTIQADGTEGDPARGERTPLPGVETRKTAYPPERALWGMAPVGHHVWTENRRTADTQRERLTLAAETAQTERGAEKKWALPPSLPGSPEGDWSVAEPGTKLGQRSSGAWMDSAMQQLVRVTEPRASGRTAVTVEMPREIGSGEGLNAAALDGIFQRDARRYDGNFTLF